MAFMSIHTMTGDPDDLLARKRAHMDPVVARLAPRHGAILSITSPTRGGIVTVNLWERPEGAMALSNEPEALQAQKESGLPMPSTFERFTDATVTYYDEVAPS
jgi:hypothetical protein